MATSWRKAVWAGIDSASARTALNTFKGMRLEPRVVAAQDTAEFRQFLDKNVEWAVLDDRTRVTGMPWRSRLERSRPSTELAAGYVQTLLRETLS